MTYETQKLQVGEFDTMFERHEEGWIRRDDAYEDIETRPFKFSVGNLNPDMPEATVYIRTDMEWTDALRLARIGFMLPSDAAVSISRNIQIPRGVNPHSDRTAKCGTGCRPAISRIATASITYSCDS